MKWLILLSFCSQTEEWPRFLLKIVCKIFRCCYWKVLFWYTSKISICYSSHIICLIFSIYNRWIILFQFTNAYTIMSNSCLFRYLFDFFKYFVPHLPIIAPNCTLHKTLCRHYIIGTSSLNVTDCKCEVFFTMNTSRLYCI